MIANGNVSGIETYSNGGGKSQDDDVLDLHLNVYVSRRV